MSRRYHLKKNPRRVSAEELEKEERIPLHHHTFDPVCPLCEDKLKDVHPYLQDWFHQLKKKFTNVHISWGFRDEESQEQAVKDGKSKLPFPKSAHNKTPALALDLFQLDEDGNARWSPQFFTQVNQENKAGRLPIFWGGQWIKLGDGDHFEYQEAQS